jgi:predicted SAM-dependent methyltransferase
MQLPFFKTLSRMSGKPDDSMLRLHIGGRTAHPDWKIFDVRAAPHVDFVGHCTDLSRFESGAVDEIYASHVLEHLGYLAELPRTLREFCRVLAPGGRLRVSVPDLDVLCALFVDPALNLEERVHLMRMMFGGQMYESDFHKTGLNEEFLRDFLHGAGFVEIIKTGDFDLFDDASALQFKTRRISLNIIARKPDHV